MKTYHYQTISFILIVMVAGSMGGVYVRAASQTTIVVDSFGDGGGIYNQGILGDNGGPTFTHSLLGGSPAIDNGSCTDMDGKPIVVDQRGMTRPEGPGCDIGAFEGQAFSSYLPFIAKSPLVELTVTSRGETIGYPTYWWVYGHVNNLASTPVYSVTVGIEVTYFPYCEPDPCDPYDTTEIVHPAFEVTLPGQANPFSWNIALGKAFAAVGEVKIASKDISGEGGKSYHPVRILDWYREGKAVFGRVRNDSGKNLADVRVVVFSDQCAWKGASLSSTSLQPGEEADFRLESFYCEGEDVTVVGQGLAGQD
jgi:hypothetical protein